MVSNLWSVCSTWAVGQFFFKKYGFKVVFEWVLSGIDNGFYIVVFTQHVRSFTALGLCWPFLGSKPFKTPRVPFLVVLSHPVLLPCLLHLGQIVFHSRDHIFYPTY